MLNSIKSGLKKRQPQNQEYIEMDTIQHRLRILFRSRSLKKFKTSIMKVIFPWKWS